MGGRRSDGDANTLGRFLKITELPRRDPLHPLAGIQSEGEITERHQAATGKTLLLAFYIEKPAALILGRSSIDRRDGRQRIEEARLSAADGVNQTAKLLLRTTLPSERHVFQSVPIEIRNARIGIDLLRIGNILQQQRPEWNPQLRVDSLPEERLTQPAQLLYRRRQHIDLCRAEVVPSEIDTLMCDP